MNERLNDLREQYGCGPIQFSGTNDALYERHLIFDQVVDPKKADTRRPAPSATSSRNAGFRQNKPTSG